MLQIGMAPTIQQAHADAFDSFGAWESADVTASLHDAAPGDKPCGLHDALLFHASVNRRDSRCPASTM
jgi:hypothetical protein